MVDLDAVDTVAQGHGLDGVLADAWEAAGHPLPSRFALRRIARTADYDGHVAMLRRIDEALNTAKLNAVALKGALLATRLYPRPSARPTTDIDLLVHHDELTLATDALRGVGYELSKSKDERRFRKRGTISIC